MKYLLSAFTGLGNSIQKTPLISAIHALDTEADVDIIGDDRSGALEVLRKSLLISRVHRASLKPKLAEFMRVLFLMNARHYDAVFLLADATPRWLRYMVYMSNARKVYQHIWVYQMRMLRRIDLLLKPAKVILVPLLAKRHEIDMALDILDAYIVKPLQRDRTTWVAIDKDLSVATRFRLPKEYICLQVGSTAGSKTAKRWPLVNFSELILSIQNKYPDLGIVTVGDQGDYNQVIKSLIEKHPALINTAGHTSLAEVASLMAMSRGLVCNDSGLMHVANAMGIPLVALYGPTDYYRTSPLGKKSVVIRKDLDCAPCMYNYGGISESSVIERCPHPACMEAITPNDVMHEIERVLLNQL